MARRRATPIYLQEQAAAPATPPANALVVYVGSDGQVMAKDDTGFADTLSNADLELLAWFAL